MKIAVLGNDNSWNELTSGSNDISWTRVTRINALKDDAFDAFFNLDDDASELDYSKFKKPVFINCVAKTLTALKAGKNIIRLNGWNGFIQRESWELAGDVKESHNLILGALKKKIVITPDEPGFISARIIAMIINEAFFAKAEKVSTENEIDIAMKLGTNYPYGPFEWGNKIGLKNILKLLQSLSKNDSRYTPAAMIEIQAHK